ncbi:TRAFs-binding domain-containing protein [Methylosarcina fibrata]|uniref:TRAFs-binding domain-containing protein n=1 Tax=Methylosarcina fibrata TaxID=105972 RepID=UPI00035FDAF8|nr:TRAFs-binding domain-containing protein [Methylosarcina fibrata]
MKPHVFVAMPFGNKPAPDGTSIDFNAIYDDLIKPACEEAGMDVFRADEEQAAGDIKTDMFQELLIADLVIADLTLDNPNVWYELGVRHALRARGVVLIQGPRKKQPFDIYTDRKLNYGLANGRPDPGTLEADKKALAGMVQATMESWHGRKISPVYHLLPNLQEPDWTSLRVGEAVQFWQAHETWKRRIELARLSGLIGDLLVLADEAPVAAFRAEAHVQAGIALRKAERFDFALEQLEKGLAVDPEHRDGLRDKGICLQRLALLGRPGFTFDRARLHYRTLLERCPQDAEARALLARIDKDEWLEAWRNKDSTPEQRRADAAYEESLLRAAVESYRQSFRCHPGHYYSGINALTLMHLYTDLTGDSRYQPEMATMAGAVRFAAGCEPAPSFWSLATLGDLEVLTGTEKTVIAAYRDAAAKAENDWFALNAVLSQLRMLQDLGFHPERVEAGIAVLDRALARLAKPKESWQPRRVFLFSGHRVDPPGRRPPRFPHNKSAIAAEKITAALIAQGAGEGDLALTQGASGGDLLFAEACARLGVRLQWLQPFTEAEFIQRSILPSEAGQDWRARYYELKGRLSMPPRAMPEALGPLPEGADPYERCNLWLLYTALALGIDKVHFICLWNGEGGDGPGGTAHMYREVNGRTGQVTWIHTGKLG